MSEDSIIVHGMSTSNFDNAAYRNEFLILNHHEKTPSMPTPYTTLLYIYTTYYFTVAVGDAFVVDFSFDS